MPWERFWPIEFDLEKVFNMSSPDSPLQQRIELLKRQNQLLRQLLENPHPGLATWMAAVPQAVDEMKAILDGKRDK